METLFIAMMLIACKVRGGLVCWSLASECEGVPARPEATAHVQYSTGLFQFTELELAGTLRFQRRSAGVWMLTIPQLHAVVLSFPPRVAHVWLRVAEKQGRVYTRLLGIPGRGPLGDAMLLLRGLKQQNYWRRLFGNNLCSLNFLLSIKTFVVVQSISLLHWTV